MGYWGAHTHADTFNVCRDGHLISSQNSSESCYHWPTVTWRHWRAGRLCAANASGYWLPPLVFPISLWMSLLFLSVYVDLPRQQSSETPLLCPPNVSITTGIMKPWTESSFKWYWFLDSPGSALRREGLSDLVCGDYP